MEFLVLLAGSFVFGVVIGAWIAHCHYVGFIAKLHNQNVDLAERIGQETRRRHEPISKTQWDD